MLLGIPVVLSGIRPETELEVLSCLNATCSDTIIANSCSSGIGIRPNGEWRIVGVNSSSLNLCDIVLEDSLFAGELPTTANDCLFDPSLTLLCENTLGRSRLRQQCENGGGGCLAAYELSLFIYGSLLALCMCITTASWFVKCPDKDIVLRSQPTTSSEIVTWLLPSSHGTSPSDQLIDHASRGHRNSVEELLTNGADLHHVDFAGWNALHAASFGGHVQIVQLLLNKGSHVDAVDNHGRTALHHASQRGHPLVVNLLLRAGADVNAPDSSGWTPLHYVSTSPNAAVGELLLANGANPHAVSNHGTSPLSIAQEKMSRTTPAPPPTPH